MTEPRVVIVDPYSSGALLAKALFERGVSCVAVESSIHTPSQMKSKFEPGHFCDRFVHTEFAVTLAKLQSFAPTHVLAGFESGVELAESLAQSLGLEGNDPNLRAARRDKFLMSEAARSHGLRTIDQFRSSQPDELVEWARSSLDWPVIVKPAKSVASDNVHRCDNPTELRQAATRIIGGVNILGNTNEDAIVQPFVDGVEYVVDMVSLDGHAKLTAIWQYVRPASTDRFVAYNAMRLLDYDGERQESLRSYALEVLSALGIRLGPSHCELIWHKDGPLLIEIGARMSAGINAVMSGICGGICQLDETVKSILAPTEFLGEMDIRPKLDRYAANVFLMPPRTGILVRTHYQDELRQLPTLHSLSLATQPGDLLSHVAGRVTLVSADRQAIDRDMATIRDYERNGIFEISEDVACNGGI